MTKLQKTERKKIKTACIGLGHMGKLHLMNTRFIDSLELVAAVDTSKSALKKAESIGVKHLFSDYEDLFNSGDVDVDAVIVSLPNFLHKDCIRLAAEKGVDVFIEKPLAQTVEDGEEIVKIVRKHGIKLAVGYNYRFFDCIEEMKRKVDEGVIGDVEIATMELILNGPFSPSFVPQPVPEWWFDNKKIGGGPLFESGDHLVDLFRWFFGDSVEVLFTCFDNHYELPYEDSAIAVLRSNKTSTKGVINVGWFSRSIFPAFDFRVAFHGTNNFISSEQLTPNNLYIHAAKEALKNFARKLLRKKINPLTYTYYFSSYAKELFYFFDCINKDVEPMCTTEEALETMKVIDKCYNTAIALNKRGD